MAMAHFLWRVEGEFTAPNLELWQQGLTLHLLFQPLTTIIVRRDDQTRHYLALEGCPSCRADGCDRVCPRILFEQLVRTTLPGITLLPVARLAQRASERRQVVAVPHRADAQLLDAAFLAQWAEGRLVTTWSRLQAKPQPITVGAQLAVTDEGPALSHALHAAGWRAVPLASLITRRARQHEVPQPIRIGTRASEALFAALRDPRHLLPGQAVALGEA
jgi:hypothetical protein